MTIEQLQKRIDELERLLARSAEFTVPANRAAIEHTLAMWQIAMQIALLRSRLPYGGLE